MPITALVFPDVGVAEKKQQRGRGCVQCLCIRKGQMAFSHRGSKFEIYENNLMSECHIRYGGYGGIAEVEVLHQNYIC